MTKRCVLWRRLQVWEAEKAEHGLCTRCRATVLKLLSLHCQCSAQKLTKSGRPFPFETNSDPYSVRWRLLVEDGPSEARWPWAPPAPPRLAPAAPVGALSARDLRGSAGPPTKRHGRSLSEPEELARGGSPRRPGGPRVWTPVTKRRCHSSGSAWSAWSWRAGPAVAGSAPAPTPVSSPEPGRRQGLLPCRSQPCVCAGGKGPWKRRRADDARWPRPALDLLKMAPTLKTSKSFCPLDYEDEDEEDDRVRTALSSPCDPRGPAIRGPGLLHTSPGLGSWWGWATGEGEGGSNGDSGD
ncbi:protein FAM53A [Capricornis sumatraensis]|uniref:protein FAM53A n=1 Tax=Capricornis sumatraensis TaxID=34865 RepID=UPI003604C79B